MICMQSMQDDHAAIMASNTAATCSMKSAPPISERVAMQTRKVLEDEYQAPSFAPLRPGKPIIVHRNYAFATKLERFEHSS